MEKEFYSNGKLLISGEYAVLDGALILAVPTRFGQSMTVKEIPDRILKWQSLDEKGTVWLDTTINTHELNTEFSTLSEHSVRATLIKILAEAQKLNPEFLTKDTGFKIETRLSFPKNWGLGTSSTLINNIAQWAQIDAFQLLWNSFKGSGYDIACAQANGPILYQVIDGKPGIQRAAFDPIFKDAIYFVYLNKKQNSREGIAAYQKLRFNRNILIDNLSRISQEMVSSQKLSDFEQLIEEHEAILSKTLDRTPVKESLFPDHAGAIKSLGAWGGDFILATGNPDTPKFFKEKGYETVIPYSQMVLSGRH